MPKAEPIQLLRSAYNQKSEKKVLIKLKGKDLYFDRDIKLSLDTQTAWQSTQTGKQFNLGSLYLYLQFHFKKIENRNQYFKKVGELGMEVVGVADAPQVVKYFSGEINQSKCINNQLKLSLINKPKIRQRPDVDNDDVQDKVQKKVKQQSKLDQPTQIMTKTIEHLNTFEKPVSSKSRCLRFPHKKFISILTHIIQNQNKQIKTQPIQTQLGKSRIATIYEKKRLPIIIVPEKTIPGNVSLENIQRFLINGQYDEYAKLPNPEVSKIQLYKNLRGKNIIFQVNSRPQLLSQKDWEYVVAVFVLGKDNQFDHWPYKSHKKIFQRPLGYMIKFSKSLSGSASDWKVKIHNLQQMSRIGDKQIVMKIWQQIQNHIFAKV